MTVGAGRVTLPIEEMSNDEQQLEELEVLTSIYPEECTVISGDAPRGLKILLVPHPGGPEENHVEISLLVTMPSEYPGSQPPILAIQIEKGLSRKHADELKVIGERAAASDIGMPTIFLVCEALKEWLCDNNAPGQDGSMYSEMMRREQKKDTVQKKQEEKKAISAAADSEMSEHIVDPEEEERIRKRQAGQPVTIESFEAWKVKFDEEMRLAAGGAAGGAAAAAAVTAAAAALGGGGEVRLSGKQLFLLNKAGKEDGEDLLAAAEGDEEGADFEDRRKLPALGEEEEEEYEDDDDEDEDEDYAEGEEDEDDYEDDDDDEDFVDDDV